MKVLRECRRFIGPMYMVYSLRLSLYRNLALLGWEVLVLTAEANDLKHVPDVESSTSDQAGFCA